MALSAKALIAIEKIDAQSMGNKKIATTLGVPQSTTNRWLQRLRSEGKMVSHNVGRPRTEEAGLCLFSLHVPSHISRTALDLCAFQCKIRRVFLPRRLLLESLQTPCCAVALVRKRLQASGTERGRSSVQRLMKAEHSPAQPVILG